MTPPMWTASSCAHTISSPIKHSQSQTLNIVTVWFRGKSSANTGLEWMTVRLTQTQMAKSHYFYFIKHKVTRQVFGRKRSQRLIAGNMFSTKKVSLSQVHRGWAKKRGHSTALDDPNGQHDSTALYVCFPPSPPNKFQRR